MTLGRLERELRALPSSPPIVGCSGTSPGNVRIFFSGSPTAQQVNQSYNYARNVFDWSLAAHNAWLRDRRRAATSQAIADPDELARIIRALALATLQIVNPTRTTPLAPLPAVTGMEFRNLIESLAASPQAD